MSNWEKWVNDDTSVETNKNRSKKPNKNFYCRKHKLGNKQYGPHEYKDNENTCVNCGHIRNKQLNISKIEETEEIEEIEERENK